MRKSPLESLLAIALALLALYGLWTFYLSRRSIPPLEQLSGSVSGVELKWRQNRPHVSSNIERLYFWVNRTGPRLDYDDVLPCRGDAAERLAIGRTVRVWHVGSTVWGLIIDGHEVLSPRQAYQARRSYGTGALWLSLVSATFSCWLALWARRSQPNNSSKPTPLRGAA